MVCAVRLDCAGVAAFPLVVRTGWKSFVRMLNVFGAHTRGGVVRE